MTQLDQDFLEVYNCFKLMLYNKSAKGSDSDDPNALTLQEVICMEIILALGRPTVSQFSACAKLSGSNSAYRIRKLIEKGYVVKIQNEDDKREFYLEATDRYAEEYGLIPDVIGRISKRVGEEFPEEDVAVFCKMMRFVADEFTDAE